MGNLISQAANGIGDALGSAFSAPFKSVFGASCEYVLMSTKRVYRRRRRYRDLEVGYQSSTDEETNFSSHHRHSSASKKRKSLGESAGVRSPAYPSSRHGRHSSHSRRHHRMKLRRKQVSFRVKGRAQRLKSLRHHRRVGSMHHHHRRESKSFKRQRLGC
ncbi:hypothetical protein CDL15_Pgr007656 [Punica granatum]|uniref:Uncharacterized protein n=1 Tax=Punica granatum TaxID=22663 RepID=A0A218XA06_PUNGR|nr:hypothetical protein CDL15_Pgr007656 [Punica granatum]